MIVVVLEWQLEAKPASRAMSTARPPLEHWTLKSRMSPGLSFLRAAVAQCMERRTPSFPCFPAAPSSRPCKNSPALEGPRNREADGAQRFRIEQSPVVLVKQVVQLRDHLVHQHARRQGGTNRVAQEEFSAGRLHDLGIAQVVIRVINPERHLNDGELHHELETRGRARKEIGVFRERNLAGNVAGGKSLAKIRKT